MKFSLLALLPSLLSAQVAIYNVTVINPRAATSTPATTVLLEGDKIREVAPAASTRIPSNYKRIDGTGRYLIPGLWDCHVHLTKCGVTSLALFLANGVTSVRDMGSDPQELLAWRRDIEAGKLLGPRIKLAGRIFESKANVDRMKRERTVEPVDRIRYSIANPEEARVAVAEQKRIGVDHLKVRTVANPETFIAMAEAARAAGLKLTGHAVASPQQLIGRMQSVEHVLSYPPLNDMSETDRRILFRQMRDAQTWMSTTFALIPNSALINYERAKALLNDVQGKLDPRRLYIGGYLLSDWREQVEEKNDPEQAKMEILLRGQMENFYRDFIQMREEGVKFLPGTDAAVALVYPGFAIHDELEVYTKHLGFSPMQALLAATHNPAEFFGIESTQGSIAPGQVADVVLLDRDPILDIKNTRSIRAVVSRGRLLDRRKLDQMLKEVRLDLRQRTRSKSHI